MICWGNRNTSEFDDRGYYVGPCTGPGFDELRNPAEQHWRELSAAIEALSRPHVGGSLDEIRDRGT